MDGTRIDYRQFGQNILDRVITEDRINGMVQDKFGQEIEFGPLGVIKVRFKATSTVNRIEVVSDKLPELCFAATVTLGFDIAVKTLILKQDYKGTAAISCQLHAQTFDPGVVFIDIPPFDEKSVDIDIDGKDLPAELFDGLVQDKLRDGIIEKANDLLADESARAFNVLELVETGLGKLLPKDK